MAAVSRHCGRRVRVPPADQHGYATAVDAELASRHYLTVLPTSDTAVRALGRGLDRVMDKRTLMVAARSVGLTVPPTDVFETHAHLVRAGPTLPYPVAIKPAIAHGAGRADGPDDLSVWTDRRAPLLVQPYLEGDLRSIAGVISEGRLAAAVHQRFFRTWPVEAGMACAAETIPPDVELERRMTDLLAGYTGIFEADLADGMLLDVNLRPYASLSLALKAGVNVVGIYCDLLRGARPPFARTRPGVFYRWLDADVRHALAEVRSGRLSVRDAAGMLRPRLGGARGGPESLSDPGPMLVRAARVFRRGRSAGRA
jgi:hypothetical protein